MSDASDVTYPEILPANDLHDDLGDDVVQTFQLESNSLRGRSVRMGSVIDEILAAHNYPEPVEQLLAETITLTTLLASMLKYDGIFTLQAKGDGPVSMIVADMVSSGGLRGCATFDAEAVAALNGQAGSLKHCLGKGYIVFTVDQKLGERYQGIVELQDTNIADCARHYFNQSEQINTGIKLSSSKVDGTWRCGGLILQEMPVEGGEDLPENYSEDDWRRCLIFLESCTDKELLDKELHSNELLHRLFHEEGVRVFEPLELFRHCRCEAERVKNVLLSMSEEERSDMTLETGVISMTCEFCSKDFCFDAKTIELIE